MATSLSERPAQTPACAKPPKTTLEENVPNAPRGSATRRAMRRIKISAAACRNRLYLLHERALARLFPGKALRILIAERPEWHDAVRQGFRRLPHQLAFGPITPRSFAEFDVVVPLEVSDLIQARQRPELLAKTLIPIPSPESVLLCDDKLRFGQALIDRGFGKYIPEIRQGPGLEYPYILKKRISWWGKDCQVIGDGDAEWNARNQINDPEFYCQRIVRGTQEFATHILFAQGRIVKSLNIKYEFETNIPIKGQNQPLYRVIHRCPYLGLFSRILSAIHFEGLCCVNYKIEDGKVYIFEINPRLGASLTPYFFSFIRHLNSGDERRTETASLEQVAETSIDDGNGGMRLPMRLGRLNGKTRRRKLAVPV